MNASERLSEMNRVLNAETNRLSASHRLDVVVIVAWDAKFKEAYVSITAPEGFNVGDLIMQAGRGMKMMDATNDGVAS